MPIFSTDGEGWASLVHSSFGPIDPWLVPFLTTYASVDKFLALGAQIAVGICTIAEVFFYGRGVASCFIAPRVLTPDAQDTPPDFNQSDT